MNSIRGARIILLFAATCLAFTAPRTLHAQTYEILHQFAGPTTDGALPGGVLLGGNGTIFGTTCYGGLSYYGTAYELSPAGKESIFYNFNAGYGACPGAMFTRHGEFYGIAGGGADRDGVTFKLDRRGNEIVLDTFGPNNAAGIYPDLYFQNSAGIFYGATQYGATGSGTLFTMDTLGKVTILYTFPTLESGSSVSGLVPDENGNLYGTMLYNGSSNCSYGCGSIFELDTAGNFTTLYSFTGHSDGAGPQALIRDKEGNLYGTTFEGGTCAIGGCGTVFKLDTSGQLTTLYSFTGFPDGLFPNGNLVRDASGNLYGTTFDGGLEHCDGFNYGGCGIVFKIDPTGNETILHSFTGAPDDGGNGGFLLLDAAGTIFGTTIGGGQLECPQGTYAGCGTIFKLTP